MAEFKPITTQEEFDTAISARLKRERETVSKQYEGWESPESVAEKLKGHMTAEQAAEKYKDFKSPEQVKELEAKIKGYETASVKTRIAHEVGIPFELVDRLSGEDEAAIRKDAETLAGFLAHNNPGSPLGSTENTGEIKDAPLKQLAASLTEK